MVGPLFLFLTEEMVFHIILIRLILTDLSTMLGKCSYIDLNEFHVTKGANEVAG